MAGFGDISYGLAVGAGQSVRRNAGNTAFEAYTPSTSGSICDTALGSANATLTGSFTAYDYLDVYVSISGLSAGANIYMRFNGDTTSNNYAFSGATGNAVLLTPTSYSSPLYFMIRINNRSATTVKSFNSDFTDDYTSYYDVFGVWRNTTDRITSISITTDGAPTLSTGSRITVFGRNA